MSGTIFLTVSALVYTVVTTILFFKKDTINKLENRIFKKLLLASITSMIVELMIVATTDLGIVGTIVQKTFLACLVLWLSIFMLYTFSITVFDDDVSEEDNIKKYKILYIIFILINIIIVGFIYALPIEFVSISDNIKYTIGPSVNVVYTVLVVYVTFMVILILKNIKTIHKKGCIPIIALIILMIVSGMIQRVHPEMLLTNALFGFIIYLMYHTIENPDLKMLREIERSRLHAEQANRAKSDFLSSMSHEIRTPLNAIVGFSEDIRDYIDEGDTARIKEDADLIVSSSETLLEIVGNIIDISKIESEKLDIVEKIYNPKEEIEKLTKATSTRIGDKPIDFHLYIAPDIPYELIGDSGKVKQVINNLLTNSIKYTEKGEINLRIDCINQNNMSVLKISCQDTGRGIKKENIEKLFTKFERLDIEKNTTTEGTGLGLAITKSLVEMMGGKINVQSRFGEGSIFIAQIPQKIKTLMSPTGNVEEINNPIKEAHIEEQPRIINSENNNNIKKVLIVDDNKLNITVAKKVLDEIVEEVESVMSGQECIDKINAGEKYDVILMDIMMPEMSGETTFKKLKEIPGFNIPVIALTADAESTSRAKYLSEGFNDYIAKPFKKDEIKSILDKYSSTGNTKTQNDEDKEVPKYDPNVDRLKDGKTYAFDGDVVKIVDSNDIETL